MIRTGLLAAIGTLVVILLAVLSGITAFQNGWIPGRTPAPIGEGYVSPEEQAARQAVLSAPDWNRPTTVNGIRRRIKVDISRELPDHPKAFGGHGLTIVGGANGVIDSTLLLRDEVGRDTVAFTNIGEWTWGFDATLSYRNMTTRVNKLNLAPNWTIKQTRMCDPTSDCNIYDLLYQPPAGMPRGSRTSLNLVFTVLQPPPSERVGSDYVRTNVIVSAGDAAWGMYDVTQRVAH